MIITRGTLKTLGTSFNARFQQAIESARSQWPLVATEVASSTAENEYGWLGDIPRVREWIGDRTVHSLMRWSYTIKNRDWELTIAVDRNDIEDDNLGIYGPKMQMMGEATQAHYDELVYGQLKNGFSQTCYDGQFFFDTDHPIIGEDGSETTFANTDGGNGVPWFLIAKGQALMPVILQKRRDYNFVSKEAPNDDGVFFQKKFVYGADARYAVGYGLPQLAWGSKQTLDAAAFNAAVAALMEMKGDHGRRLGLREFRLVVPPALRAAALTILEAQFIGAGESNINYKAAELVVCPWLA